MNILVYATTLGADLLSMVRYLENKPDVQLRILVKKPKQFLREPVNQLFPLKSELLSASFIRSFTGVRGFRPDITLVDNHLPYRKTSPALFILWHGFGWKGPNDMQEFKWLHKQIASGWGDATLPNKHFVWQCFGPWDFKHRTEVSGFHPDNCHILGAASHDELRKPIDKSLVQPFYPFDVQQRKTVLLAPTWHYGEVFSHWGGDRIVLTKLLENLYERSCNVILRLHDSFRFEKSYVRWLYALKQQFPNLLLKFKDHNPDNFLDLQVADVLVTNYSSIANLYYATGKPTIHIYPVKAADEAFIWRKYTLLGQKSVKIPKARFIWKLPPEEHGGLMAKSAGELIDMVGNALDNPGCCHDQSREFLQRHMLGADGGNRERIYKTLKELQKNGVSAMAK